MESGGFPENQPFHTNSLVQAEEETMHSGFVGISNDEDRDMDDGQPESSRRAILSPSTHKRAVAIDSDENDSGNELDMLYQFMESTRTKRQKVDHTDSTNSHGTQHDGHRLTSAPEVDQQQGTPTKHISEFAKVNLTFDGVNHGDDQATLAFRPYASPKAALTSIRRDNPKQDYYRRVLEELEAEKGKIKLQAQPYYDDTKFETRMYCGPGYERFPVVLGSMPEHQDICDEWDRVQAKKSARRRLEQANRAELARYINDTIELGNSEEDEEDDEADEADGLRLSATELECLYNVREVLPDIERGYALDKIRSYIQTLSGDGDDELQIQPNPADVVSLILELPEYPKQERSKNSRVPAADGTGVTIEWQKGEMESKTYQRDAVVLLAGQFDHVPTHFISRIVQEKKALFESYLYIYDLNMNYDNLSIKERPYRRFSNPRISLEKKYLPVDTALRSKIQWSSLVNELQAARQQIERDTLRMAKEKQEQALEEDNLQRHKASGDLVECQCCFDVEIPLNRAVSCEDKSMHWFCFECVRGLAEHQVGSMKHEMNCMHQSGCQATLSSQGIRCAISNKLFEKLAFYQQQFEITAACIEGLEQCPFCDFKAICDLIEVDSIFQCQNPNCRRVSCRKCHEDNHLPKSCEESKSDRRVSARHQVEEARSEAMMRTCPKCKVKIIKEAGCNKMKCAKCGCTMCYVCNADISGRKDGGYGHFHEPGAKCILYDKDFDRHRAEADEAEKAAIKKVQAENADIDEKQLQIETGTTKTKKPVLKKDELGFGWGRDFPPAPPVLRNGEFDDVFRQQRRHFDHLYRRLVQTERPQTGRLDNNFIPNNPPKIGPVQGPLPRDHGLLYELSRHIQRLHSERAAQNSIFPAHDVQATVPTPGRVPERGPVQPPFPGLQPRDIVDNAWPHSMQGRAQNLRSAMPFWGGQAGMAPQPMFATHENQVQGMLRTRRQDYDPLVLADVGAYQQHLHVQQPPLDQPYMYGGGFARNLFHPWDGLGTHPPPAGIPVQGYRPQAGLVDARAWENFANMPHPAEVNDHANVNPFGARTAHGTNIPFNAGLFDLPF